MSKEEAIRRGRKEALAARGRIMTDKTASALASVAEVVYTPDSWKNREIIEGSKCSVHGLPAETQVEFIRQVLSLKDDFGDQYADIWESVWWRTDTEYAPVTFWINCNDVFYWACADAEEITPANFHMIEEAVRDVANALEVCATCDLPREIDHEVWSVAYDIWHKVGAWAAELFCARSRGMRPQRPSYDECYPECLWPLFDACGPKRDRKSEG